MKYPVDCHYHTSEVNNLRETPQSGQLSPLQQYMQEVSQYPLINSEEVISLAKRYQLTGDPEAANKLLVSNLRLVVKIACNFQKCWTQNLMDMIQEGNIGLMQAVKKFDPSREIKLTHYASFWIKAYILKYIMDNYKLIKIGTTLAQRKLFFNLRKEKEKLHTQGIEVDHQLLAHRLQVKENEVMAMDQRLESWEYSLDTPRKHDGDVKIIDFLTSPAISPEEEVAQIQMKEVFRKSLQTFQHSLKKKEQDILVQRLLAEKPLTLRELGERHNISRERTRQIEERMIEKLRVFLYQEIPDFMHYKSMLSPG